jgi:hypothetical protein
MRLRYESTATVQVLSGQGSVGGRHLNGYLPGWLAWLHKIEIEGHVGANSDPRPSPVRGGVEA